MCLWSDQYFAKNSHLADDLCPCSSGLALENYLLLSSFGCRHIFPYKNWSEGVPLGKFVN